MSKGFKDLLQKVYECDRKTVAVAVAEDEPVLEAVKAAKEKASPTRFLSAMRRRSKRSLPA